MGKTLMDWVEENGATDLYRDIECHVSAAAPEDIARMVMISVRQWAENRVPSK